ncbi:hypothetical protein ACF1DV_35485 [Streptomyces achromogenes]|uniref:hypothetical protein n=1 Tax=Streptomyces achromogenes TaxID=67255 RepID=UPI0036FE2B93
MAQPYRIAGDYQDPTGLYHLEAATTTPPSAVSPRGSAAWPTLSNDGKEVYDAVSSAAQDDTDALVVQASGIAAGIVVESACRFVVGCASKTVGSKLKS